MNLWKILTGTATGIALTLLCLLLISQCNRKKSDANWSSIVNTYKNAPIKIKDSITHDTVKVAKWLKPATVIVHDTPEEFKHYRFCEKFYSDSIKYVKGLLVGKIKYEIAVKDCEAQVRFPQIILPTLYRTETRTVTKDSLIPYYTPKNHFGLDINLYGRNFKEFPGGGADFWFEYRDKWGIKAGGLYLPQVKTGFVIVGGRIFFN